ncbi:UNVERIFIED_CONTAM: hypothetical protein RMT77_005579 [Armadillidium vulgare]
MITGGRSRVTMAARAKTIIKFKPSRIIIVITSIIIFIYIADKFIFPVIENEDSIDREFYEDIELRREVITKITPVFAIVICGGNKDSTKLEDDFRRQMEQSYVLLKSAAILASKSLRFIVLVDHNDVFEELLAMLSRWPENIRKKILLEKGKIVYPENGNFREKFRLCASERLFLHEALPSEEAVIFLDTDIIFLKSPEILWEEFAFFNPDQLSGLSPSLYLYHRFYKFPVYGKSGLNAGVWMMNLTRIRSIPGGWTNAILKIACNYERKLGLFDQDIANIIFNKNPQYLYELSCRWNYRDNICHLKIHPCRRVETTGIFLLHGCALNFYLDHNQKFKSLFKAFLKFEVESSLEELLQTIKTSLKNIDPKIDTSRCSKLSNIDEMLTKSLEKTISLRI